MAEILLTTKGEDRNMDVNTDIDYDGCISVNDVIEGLLKFVTLNQLVQPS